MNKLPPSFRSALRWLAMAALFGMILVMFLLPPPASTLALLACVLVSVVLVLKRLGYSRADYERMAREAADRIVRPARAILRLVMWVNRGQGEITIVQAEGVAESRLLSRLGVVVEIAIIVWMVSYATARFYTADWGLQLSGGETEWITSSAYAAANGLRDYGRIPLWQPLLEYGEPLVDNPVSFVLNPFSTAPSLILGAVTGLKISVALTTLVAGLGGWVLGWTMGFGALGRVLLALLLVGKGNMHAMFHTGYFQLAASQAYFPWIIAGTVGIFRLRGQRWPVVALALGSALLFFAGNVWYTLPMAICVVVVGVVYLIHPHPSHRDFLRSLTPSPLHGEGEKDGFEAPPRKRGGVWVRVIDWRGLGRLVLAGVLTVGISAMIFLPLAVNQGQLGKHPPESEAGWIVPLWNYAIPFYFNPDPFQHVEFFTPHNQKWVTEMNIDRVAEFFYSFVTPYWFLGLIFIALPFYRPRWNRLWWAAWALLIFFTLWGAGRFTWIYENIPFFQGWRFVGRAFGVGSFWIAVLVAMRADSLWRIITTTRWMESGFGSFMKAMPILLGGVLVAGAWTAAYRVNEQWDQSPNTSVLRIDDDDLCVSWLRAQFPDRELAIWRWGYEGVTTLMNNRVRIYDVLADFEMSPVPSTIGSIDLTRTLPEFALLNSNIEREFMGIQGYRVVPGSPNFPKTISPCMYRKADALSYIYTVPLDVVLNAPEPSPDMYAQPFTTLPADQTTPVTTYVRQPDLIVMVVQGDVIENRVLTVQERAYPGWRVTMDGRPAKLESVGGQIGVLLPRDLAQHVIIFEYRPTLVVVGGWITLAASTFSILYLVGVDRILMRIAQFARRRPTITQAAEDGG